MVHGFQTARISYHHGATHLSAETPYDRELVFDQVHLDASHYGTLRLELDRHAYLVHRTTRGAIRRCTRCHRVLRALAYTTGSRTFCERCMRSHTG